VLTDHAASLLFAPTVAAVRHLADEGIHGGVIQSDAGPIIPHYLLLPFKETPYARY